MCLDPLSQKSPRLTNDSDQQSGQNSGNASSGHPRLGLFVPSQAAAPPDSFLLDTRETEAWFASLPMANVGETARRVYSTLVDFNRMVFPPMLRARNAELFREPVEYICSNLRRHFVDTGFPLSEKGRKAAALARALYQEMAISYKSIIQDLLMERGERFDRKLLVIALHRALSYLNLAMRFTTLTYAPWPAGLWREIHAIYAYASQNRIQQVSVKHSGKEKSTLESVYLASLLFATATPHRLRQGQQLALAKELPGWTEHVVIGLPDEDFNGPGRYLVDLFSDSPPVHDNLEAPAANRRLRRLDLHPLLKHLRHRFEETPWDGGASTDTRGHALSRPLLRLLILCWSTSRERRFVRTRLGFELHVLTGLHRLHDYLLQQQREQEPDGDTKDRYSSRFTSHHDTKPIDPWSEPYSHGLGTASVEAESIPTNLFDESPFGNLLSEPAPMESLPELTLPETPGDTVHTLNESAGGYCIQWRGEKLPKVWVGELLGLQGRESGTELSLAVIRWMRQDGNQPLQFGVELIASRCLPGEATPTGESRSRYPTIAQRCLVVPGDPHNDSADSLILPSALYGIDAQLHLSCGGKRQTIRLTGMVETTGAFARYHYETVQTRKQMSQSATQEQDFGDLWTNL